LCASRAVVSGGRLHVLNLSTIRDRLGNKWPQIADKVAFVIRRTLEQRLVPHDIHNIIDETMVVVVFAGLSVEQAAFKSNAIAQEIMAKLFGDAGDGNMVQIQRAVVGPDGAYAFEVVDPLRMVIDAIGKPPIIHDSPADPPPRGIGRGGVSQSERAGTRGDAAQWGEMPGRAASRGLAPTSDEVPVGSAAAYGQGGQPLEGEYQQQLYELMRVIGTTRDKIDDWRRHHPSVARALFNGLRRSPGAQALPAVSRRSSGGSRGAALAREHVWPSRSTAKMERQARRLAMPGALKDAEFSYQPTWFAGKGAVTLYACELWFKGAQGRSSIDEITGSNPDPLIAGLTDLLIVRKGLSDIARCCVENKKALVSIPVHYATIANRETRDKLIALCESVPNLIRRLLILEITNCRAADWKQLGNFITPLTRVCRSVSLRLGIGSVVPPDLAAMGVSWVGGDIRDYDRGEAEAIERLRLFAAEAKRAGLASYVLGLGTRSLTLGAVFGGFDYAGGTAVAPSVDSPAGVHGLELIDLYQAAALAAGEAPGSGAAPIRFVSWPSG